MSAEPQPHDLRDLLASTRVGEITIKNRATLLPSNSVGHAADQMRARSHGSALVCEDGRLVGIFTERDLLRIVAGDEGLGMPLSEVMTKNPKTITTEKSLMDAVNLLEQGGYRRLPVVDADGTPVGIIDVKTLVHFLVEHFPESIYNQASLDQLIARNPEGA